MSDRLNNIWNNSARTPVLIGLVAFNVGIGVGYFLGLHKKKVQVLSSDQLISNFNVDNLANTRAYQSKDDPTVIVVPRERTVEDIKQEFEASKAKREAREARVSKSSIVIEQIEEEPVQLVTRSVFSQEDEWDFAKEVRRRERRPDEPYVVHRDEFFSEEIDYIQKQYTYYAGDNILCDDDNSPVYNHAQVTGDLKFGHGSGDSNIVYIRNNKRKEEYEVILDQGLYSTEVLGLEIEDNTRVKDLKHTHHRRIRQGDDE